MMADVKTGPSAVAIANEKTDLAQSWPDVIRAVAFYSLLEQQSELAWTAAISVAKQRPEEIDLSLLPADAGRKSALVVWRQTYNLPAQLIVDMYDVITTKAKPVEADTDERFMYTDGQLIRFWSDRSRRSYYAPDKPASIPTGTIIQPANNDVLQQMLAIPQTGFDDYYKTIPLYAVLPGGYIDVFVALLERLPVIELDTYAQPSEKQTESPEYWLRVGSHLRDRLPNLDPICAAARNYMDWYRRRRSLLLRTVLVGVLPSVLLIIIDDYGAAPPRKAFDC